MSKPDIKAYPKLKDMQSFNDWFKDITTMARLHQVSEILDPTWRPLQTREDLDLFDTKQAFFYAVLRYTVRPIQLRELVDKYLSTSDAQGALREILFHMRSSTHAMISTKTMMEEIVTTRLDMKQSKSTYDFIVAFDHLFTKYNQMQRRPEMRLNIYQKRQYMQNALANIKTFRDISEREMDRITMGQQEFTYDEYLTQAKSTATRIDSTRKSSSSRDINMLIADGWISEDDMSDSESGYNINETKRQFRDPSHFAGQMNKETWTSLTPETQQLWDKIDRSEKARILEYKEDRAKRRQQNLKANTHKSDKPRETSVNVHDTTPTETEDDEKSTDAGTPGISVNTARVQFSVNNATQQARSDAHPGDPRRVLGSNKAPPEPSKKAQLLTMMHRCMPRDASDDDGSASSSDCSDPYEAYWTDFHKGSR